MLVEFLYLAILFYIFKETLFVRDLVVIFMMVMQLKFLYRYLTKPF